MSIISPLPPSSDLQPISVLKKVPIAHRHLGELKGAGSRITNQRILLDTLSLQEARESTAIENIISTFTDIYQSDRQSATYITPEAKEVHSYAVALQKGFDLVRESQLLTVNHIIEVQSILDQNNAGFRKLPGTVLKNEETKEIVYTPPQHYDEIVSLMDNLQICINDPNFFDADPLVKLAVIHHQFESIHPFYDGNGRTGRIVNILYLIQQDLLHSPILYMSRYIIQHKSTYYRLLQHVRNTGDWEEWIHFILDAIIETSRNTLHTIFQIEHAMFVAKNMIKAYAPKLYSQELLSHLYRHPYTKIEYLMQDLDISRNTAIRYLEELIKSQTLVKIKRGRDNYYLNNSLLNILIHPQE